MTTTRKFKSQTTTRRFAQLGHILDFEDADGWVTVGNRANRPQVEKDDHPALTDEQKARIAARRADRKRG